MSEEQHDEADRITTVDQSNALEEMVLRHIDGLQSANSFDAWWLAMGRTNIVQAFMALNRAVMPPLRIKLPGDPT